MKKKEKLSPESNINSFAKTSIAEITNRGRTSLIEEHKETNLLDSVLPNNGFLLIHPILAILNSRSESKLMKAIQYFIHLSVQIFSIYLVSKFELNPILICFETLLISSALGYGIGLSLKKFKGKPIGFKSFFITNFLIYLIFCAVLACLVQDSNLELYEQLFLIIFTIIFDLLICDPIAILLCRWRRKLYRFFRFRGFADDIK